MATREEHLGAAAEAYVAGLLRQAARTPQDAARAALGRGASQARVDELASRIAADRAERAAQEPPMG